MFSHQITGFISIRLNCHFSDWLQKMQIYTQIVLVFEKKSGCYKEIQGQNLAWIKKNQLSRREL